METTVRFELTNNGFAGRPLNPLGHVVIEVETPGLCYIQTGVSEALLFIEDCAIPH